MTNMIHIEEIRKYTEQYQKYIESNQKLNEMIKTESSDEEWKDNYHIINHDWIIKWKNTISFDDLDKQNYAGNYNKIYKYIEKNVKPQKLYSNNNQTIHENSQSEYIDPMKRFDIISDEMWKLFDIQNKNINCNGKVSLLKGNRKIIIRFDENNYSVKYLSKEDILREFVIIFDYLDESNKKKIIKDVAQKDIYEWMQKIGFKYDLKQFTINYDGDKAKFDIKQKTNNYEKSAVFNSDEIKKAKLFPLVSFSESSFSIVNSIYNVSTSSFLSSGEFSSFFNEIKNFRYILKYEHTSNICSIIRCFTMIESLVSYFTNPFKYFFSNFESTSLINIIREVFSNLWSNEKTPYAPEKLIRYIKGKGNINIEEEQDPVIFLNYILDYMHKKLNKIDNINYGMTLNIKGLKNESYYSEVNKIIEKNNSIISQNFWGLILERFDCEKCKDETIEKVRVFNLIEINFGEIIESLSQKGNSLVSLDMDDFISYYFLRKKSKDIPAPMQNCPKCGYDKAKIIKRVILRYPPYLIIKSDEGNFEEKKGFSKDSSILSSLKIEYTQIEYLKQYVSKKITDYENKDFKYELFSIINYLKDEKIFLTICKYPFPHNNKNIWISFMCNSETVKLEGYRYKKTHPYLYFYKFVEK